MEESKLYKTVLYKKYFEYSNGKKNYFVWEPCQVVEGEVVSNEEGTTDYFVDQSNHQYDELSVENFDVSADKLLFYRYDDLKNKNSIDDVNKELEDYYNENGKYLLVASYKLKENDIDNSSLETYKEELISKKDFGDFLAGNSRKSEDEKESKESIIINVFNTLYENMCIKKYSSFEQAYKDFEQCTAFLMGEKRINDIDRVDAENQFNVLLAILKTAKAKFVDAFPNNIDKIEEEYGRVTEYFEEEEEFYNELDSDEIYDNEDESKNKKSEKFNHDFDCEKMYNSITSAVIAQDYQVKCFVSEIHKRMLSLRKPVLKREKFGMMFVGPTGVGKTEVITRFANLIGLPVVIVDSTQLTKSGYTGDSLNDALRKLYGQCEGDIEKMSHAIVVFDEIDKKAAEQNTQGDVSGKAVQDMILKFMDGTDYLIPVGYGEKKIKINTKDMTVISAGSFEDMFNALNKNGMGFDTAEGKESKKKYIPDNKDFIKFGMSKEFMGRNFTRIFFNELTEDDMLEIMNRSVISPILLEQEIFKDLHVHLKWNEGYLRAVAKQAVKNKLGARSLTEIVVNSLRDVSINVQFNPDKYNVVAVNEDTVYDNKVYKLRRNRNAKAKGNI